MTVYKGKNFYFTTQQAVTQRYIFNLVDNLSIIFSDMYGIGYIFI